MIMRYYVSFVFELCESDKDEVSHLICSDFNKSVDAFNFARYLTGDNVEFSVEPKLNDED